MTALKPLENRRVRAVASERYPLNKKCAHPECNEPAVDPHHAFPRSAIGGDSWFVEIRDETPTGEQYEGTDHNVIVPTLTIIPHVTGLCREHHEAVERHDAWIKLEDGVWMWYDRVPDDKVLLGETGWEPRGPLNPQPGSVEGKTKRKRFQGEARRTRRTISLRVPDDAGEDGAALMDEAVESLEEKINPDDTKRRPIYFTLMDAVNYTLLNAGPDDFGGA